MSEEENVIWCVRYTHDNSMSLSLDKLTNEAYEFYTYDDGGWIKAGGLMDRAKLEELFNVLKKELGHGE